MPVLARRLRPRLVAHPLPPEASPLELFRRLAPEESPLFLDSAGGPAELSRFSFLAWGRWPALETPHDPSGSRDPFARLERAVRARGCAAAGGFPPIAGIGWLGYDLGRCVERLPSPPPDPLDLPAMRFAFPAWIVARDEREGRNALLSRADSSGRARRIVEAVLRRPPRPARFRATSPLRGEFSRAEYEAAVERARQLIACGDLFEVNLSHRLVASFEGDPLALHERLRRSNAAPFAACLIAGNRAVLSSSPERFLRIAGRTIETRPIKGTRPRTGEPAADDAAVADLEASAKERAELTMVVDVERNDLSRVCEPGTVRVPRLGGTEAYARVFQRVATVEGRLREGAGLAEILRATFPSGSVTGAPKIRAMESIAAIELSGRGVYTGALGWIGGDGSLDLSVAIRTVAMSGRRLAVGVGGGIVYDSDPRAEFEETLAKSRAIEEAIGP